MAQASQQLEKNLDLITTLFKDKSVRHAYLFGSQSSGKITPLSDLDFAVFFDKHIKQENYLDLKLRLMTELEDILGVSKVDVVTLNTASPLLKYQATNLGKIIYSADKEERFTLEHQALQEYEDFLPFLKTQYNLQRQAIKENRFGKPLIKKYVTN